jgi:hypothetical protein
MFPENVNVVNWHVMVVQKKFQHLLPFPNFLAKLGKVREIDYPKKLVGKKNGRFLGSSISICKLMHILQLCRIITKHL